MQNFALVESPEDEVVIWSILSIFITSFLGMSFLFARESLRN